MPTTNPYQAQDIQGVLYNSVATPITADGNSTEIDFSVDGGCPDGNLIINVTDRETNESAIFIVQDNISGSFADTLLRLHGIAANGTYYIPINNRVVKGSKLRLRHDITFATGTDGMKIHAHFEPSGAQY